MKYIENVGLICEGGGTKAAYTSGVLHCLIDHNIYFDYSVGISAGAANLLCYLAKQPARLQAMGIDAASDKKSMGFKSLLKEKSFFALDYVYDSVEAAVPLDFEEFKKSPMKLDVGLYNFDTDQVEYVDKDFHDHSSKVIKAACALAILCPPIQYRGKKYMDAGIVDMIPIEQSVRHGNKKHLFISTKEENYVRKPASSAQIVACKLRYSKYPNVAIHLKNRHLNYEKQWNIVKELREQEKCMILRPSRDLGITRYTQDKEKLTAWYQLGYDDTVERLESILKFCEVE